jgi:hypothetical protein
VFTSCTLPLCTSGQGRPGRETGGRDGGGWGGIYCSITQHCIFKTGSFHKPTLFLSLISTSLLNKNRGKEGGQTGKHNLVFVCVTVCVCVRRRRTHAPSVSSCLYCTDSPGRQCCELQPRFFFHQDPNFGCRVKYFAFFMWSLK